MVAQVVEDYSLVPNGQRRRGKQPEEGKRQALFASNAAESVLPKKVDSDVKQRSQAEAKLYEAFFNHVWAQDDVLHAFRDAADSLAVPAHGLHKLGKDLLRSCWKHANQVFATDEPLIAARAEVAHLKRQLSEVHLTCMQQLHALRVAESRAGKEMKQDLITFHEPLRYLDHDTKELVLYIVVEKVRLLESSQAPNSLIKSLLAHIEQCGSDSTPFMTQDAQAADLPDLQEELTALQTAAKVAEKALVAKDRELRACKQDLDALPMKIQEANEALETKHKELQKESKKFEKELGNLRDQAQARAFLARSAPSRGTQTDASTSATESPQAKRSRSVTVKHIAVSPGQASTAEPTSPPARMRSVEPASPPTPIRRVSSFLMPPPRPPMPDSPSAAVSTSPNTRVRVKLSMDRRRVVEARVRASTPIESQQPPLRQTSSMPLLQKAPTTGGLQRMEADIR